MTWLERLLKPVSSVLAAAVAVVAGAPAQACCSAPRACCSTSAFGPSCCDADQADVTSCCPPVEHRPCGGENARQHGACPCCWEVPAAPLPAPEGPVKLTPPTVWSFSAVADLLVPQSSALVLALECRRAPDVPATELFCRWLE